MEPWTKGLPYTMTATEEVQYSPTPYSFGFPCGDSRPVRHGFDIETVSISSSETHVSVYEPEFLDDQVHNEEQPGENYGWNLNIFVFISYRFTPN